MNKTEEEKPEGVIFFEGVMNAMQELKERTRKQKECDEAIEKEVLRRIVNNEFSSEQLLELYKINNEAIKRSGVDLNKLLSPAIDAMAAAQQGEKPEQSAVLDGLRQLSKVVSAPKKKETEPVELWPSAEEQINRLYGKKRKDDDYNPSSSDVCEDYGPGGFSPVD